MSRAERIPARSSRRHRSSKSPPTSPAGRQCPLGACAREHCWLLCPASFRLLPWPKSGQLHCPGFPGRFSFSSLLVDFKFEAGVLVIFILMEGEREKRKEERLGCHHPWTAPGVTLLKVVDKAQHDEFLRHAPGTQKLWEWIYCRRQIHLYRGTTHHLPLTKSFNPEGGSSQEAFSSWWKASQLLESIHHVRASWHPEKH